jgi:Uri superfamily endonuclease
MRASETELLSVLNGVYVLIIQVGADIEVPVGARGRMIFKKGLYAYVGSAQTNLEQRIKRHFRKEKRKFWHIDYLLDNDAAKIVKVFFKNANKAEECMLGKVIGELGIAIDGFGCSDCNCRSHLFRVSGYGFLQKLMQELNLVT